MSSIVLRRQRVPLISAIAAVAAGCAARPENPSFPVDVAAAQERIREMQSDPKPLTRPLIILNGWLDPGFTTIYLRDVFGRAFEKKRVVSVCFTFSGTFDRCRRKVIEAVDRAFPSSDPVWTTEVDVIGVSMGGLVARYAAAEREGGRRLRIARLFTIATPHRGARSARMPTLDPLLRDMRAGSDLLSMLDAQRASCQYTIVPYVRLGDSIVGPRNASPPGDKPWWLPNRPLDLAHIGVAGDPRILADIMLRLRGAAPLSTEPRAPLPAE